jgi:hypothetical protein
MVATQFLSIFKALAWKHHKAIRLKLVKAFPKLNVLVTQGEDDFSINQQVSFCLILRKTVGSMTSVYSLSCEGSKRNNLLSKKCDRLSR